MSLTLQQAQAKLAQMDRTIKALQHKVQSGTGGGAGGGTGGAGGVSGFSIDTDGNLIVTYAGAAPDISIDATGTLQLEI